MRPFDAAAFLRDFEARVVHEDRHVLCLDKPAGLLSQPDASGAAAAAELAGRWLAQHRSGSVALPVHRLDRRTTGCLLLARSHKAASRLTAAFAAGRVVKHYLCVVPSAAAGGIAARRSLGRGADAPGGRIGVGACGRVARGGDEIVEWKSLAVADGKALLAVGMLGGKRHQIRSSLASVGRPLLGDVRFGGRAELGGALALHAATLSLPHPIAGREPLRLRTRGLPAEWRSALPEGLQRAATDALLDDASALWQPPPEAEG